jgi:hypothetical protein
VPRGDTPPLAADQLPARRPKPQRPLRGTWLAYRYRRARRWATATLYARRHNARLPADAPTLDFHPFRPHPKTQVVRILALLGVRIGFDPRAEGPVMAWDGGTWFDPRAQARLPAGALNGRCLDISKSTVARAWGEVAGYELAVDPLTHRGPLVVKSERNGFHDGRLVEGPLAERAPGVAYERFIDSSRDGVVTCLRTPIIGRAIPVMMIKWRPAPGWFSGTVLQEPRPTDEIYSADEVALLLRYADAIGMDYGELDVVRDAASGLIYVVDANRTPVRNPLLDPRHDAAIYPAMAEAFRALLGI